LEWYSIFTTSVKPYTCGFAHHLFIYVFFNFYFFIFILFCFCYKIYIIPIDFVLLRTLFNLFHVWYLTIYSSSRSIQNWTSTSQSSPTCKRKDNCLYCPGCTESSGVLPLSFQKLLFKGLYWSTGSPASWARRPACLSGERLCKPVWCFRELFDLVFSFCFKCVIPLWRHLL